METNSVAALMAALAGTPLAPMMVYLPLIVAVAGVFATFLPQAAPGSLWAAPRAALDLVAMNFGNARNATISKPPVSTPPQPGA